MMRQLFLTLLLAVSFGNCFSQGAISTLFHDESNGLVPTEGTAMINDAGANGGACMFRPASSAGGTFFAGPYVPVTAGNYLFQVRIKVSSNSSIANLFTLDIVSQYGAIVYGSMWITPNMFKASNEWQLITIPVSIPHGIPNLEMRGMNFQPGVTDMYVDYVQLIPSSVSGLYSPELSISGKGDVGIGTTTPREKLSVNGNIRAREIKVEATNWPDYVFDEGYKVGTLEELEGYIKANRHLPGMPSAKDIETNGLVLGEVVKLQQKKIEELTLHLIEKDKALKKVAVENIQLKAKQAEQDYAIKKMIQRMDKIELKER
ncbi:hypothetical protein OQX63_17555 [Pedobacter sp. PF22-3]|uniref:hypothetical protein n=1 Tax=Pedobacter sp. PF22-3 TaxID=2994467 RepID=UPI002245F8FE|nr:hypothetical protein [Pedobacter sp. PF22-3]MCX2495301.1 hypothetical protein [Pedobacter sp. PF22-3]